MDCKQRLKLVYGESCVENLSNRKILIAGLGGVGGYAAEAITRSFVGNIVIIDFDVYDITNLNRQLHSTIQRIGKYKADVIEDNIYAINQTANVIKIKEKLTISNISEFVTDDIDFVIDAIDDVRAKVELIDYCCKNNIKIISSMGTGNKVHPEMLQISDIYKTSVCPLAKRIRKELKDRNVKSLPVVYSTEDVIKNEGITAIGSTPFVPAAAGLMLASYVINNLTGK